MLHRILTCLAITLMLVGGVKAQEHRLVVMADRQDAGEFFTQLSLQSGINIIYSDDVIASLPTITLQLKGVSVEEVIQRVLHGSDIQYSFTGDQIILFRKAPENVKYTVSGIVTDSLSGEPLISAYIYDVVSGRSTNTNNYGYYSLTLPKGRLELIAGYINYVQKTVPLNFHQNEFIPIKLYPNGLLPTVIVKPKDRPDENIWVPSAQRITFADLQSNIHIGGGSDLYRRADFITGVHTGTDGVGGIHVRGGANDQNLILMDGVPVYHPNHLLGIVSVFNYQVLQQASIYKANFPSRFSGRLSSVMDVRTREGNINDWSLTGNVAVSEFSATAEGPLVKDKIGVLISGRFFLPGIFIPEFSERYKEREGYSGESDLDYFDFNGKINWKIGEKDSIYLSTYRGKDKYRDNTYSHRQVNQPNGLLFIANERYDKRLNWKNRTGVLRWNHLLSDKIFANIILSTSEFELQSADINKYQYFYIDTLTLKVDGFLTKEFKSKIQDKTARLELDIRPSQDHEFAAGLYAIKYKFEPKSITLNDESNVGNFPVDEGLIEDRHFSDLQVKAVEAGAYFEDKWKASERVQFTSGIHISNFFVQGRHYMDPQLRFSFDYLLTPDIAFNLGYSRMTQYLHNLSSSTIGLPTDLWVPTTDSVPPALSDQYSLSAKWKISDALAVDFSAYNKDMRKLINFKEGASFLLPGGNFPSSIVDAANWEDKITKGGVGDASGIELQINYEVENAQFYLNGTWSRSYRTFEGINNGKPFPDSYDRRWSGTFSSSVQFGKKWKVGANFIYGTGIAITLAESKFISPGGLFPEVGLVYPERNGFRLPPYHRLDLSFNYLLEEKKSFNHSLTLNLYNVYNRTNPFYVTLVQVP